jgi:hypothetical protein
MSVPIPPNTHRNADTWPKHRAKAKRRHLARKDVARAAQEKRDAEQRGL